MNFCYAKLCGLYIKNNKQRTVNKTPGADAPGASYSISKNYRLLLQHEVEHLSL